MVPTNSQPSRSNANDVMGASYTPPTMRLIMNDLE
jgi:hypothetical protein